VAITTQIAASTRALSPFALWHLLSLDAPTVAALWTWFIARCCRIHLPVAAPLAMLLAVWIVYAADRVLDAARANRTGNRSDLEARHLFHGQHRRAFAAGIAIASITLGALLPFLDPAALRLYLIEGALLAGWLLLLHATRSSQRLPKEIAVGVFFSAAVFIPTVARTPTLRMRLAPDAILLGALCALNCLLIYAWEHQSTAETGVTPHATTQYALRHLIAFASTVIFFAFALAAFSHNAIRLIAMACALSAALLLTLDRWRLRLSRIHLRTAADLALLTPILLLPLLPLTR